MGVGGGAEYTSAMPLGDVFQDNVTLTASFLIEIFNRERVLQLLGDGNTDIVSSPPHKSRCGWYKMKVCKTLSSEIEKQSPNAKDVQKCIICICSTKICYVVSCGIWIKCHKILDLTRLVSNNILHIFPNVLIKGSESK